MTIFFKLLHVCFQKVPIIMKQLPLSNTCLGVSFQGQNQTKNVLSQRKLLKKGKREDFPKKIMEEGVSWQELSTPLQKATGIEQNTCRTSWKGVRTTNKTFCHHKYLGVLKSRLSSLYFVAWITLDLKFWFAVTQL